MPVALAPRPINLSLDASLLRFRDRVRCFYRELGTPAESQRIIASQLVVFGVPLSPRQPASFRCSVFLFVFFDFFVRFSKKGSKKNGRKKLGKYMLKTCCKKAEGEILFPCHFPPSICFYRIFGRFSA
jgi:hypothetical protein